VIVAHHMGEELLPALVAGGASAVPALLLVTRVRLSRVVRVLRRQKATR
jgi:hypothetical protein